MSSATNKLTVERNQRLLLELLSKPGNDICADCKSRNPRWASHNLGIFLCVGCASIHRKIGTHITKVKSLTLDSWTKEQVDNMKAIGNIKSNAIYNPNEVRNPPPPQLDDSTRDHELEQYIRSKYEYRRFLDKKALVTSKLGPSRSASSLPTANSTPPSLPARPAQPPTQSKTATATDIAANMFSTTNPQLRPYTTLQTAQGQPSRSVSQPVISLNSTAQSAPAVKPEGVWADLVSLQGPSTNASLPLQYQASNPTFGGMTASNTIPMGLPSASMNMPTAGLSMGAPSMNPFSQQSFTTGLNQTTPSYFPQMQPQPTAVPFHQPQPLSSSLIPPQSQNHFISSSPNPQFLAPSPGAQFMPSPSPQLQSTMSHPSLQFPASYSPAGGVGPRYMTPSPQPMMAAMPGQTQMSGMGMQPVGIFTHGSVQPPQPMTMGGQFVQGQYMQGGFPGQFPGQAHPGTQWGPL